LKLFFFRIETILDQHIKVLNVRSVGSELQQVQIKSKFVDN